MNMTLEERLSKRTRVTVSGCIEWTGSTNGRYRAWENVEAYQCRMISAPP